jgi:translation initiation factor IF-3
VETRDAIQRAKEAGMDLVEVSPNSRPPVCRIMDYGKFLYELHKKEHEAKKHQKQVQIKEIKFRPKISVHDYDFKMNHVKRFLEEGNKVKITIMLRGREKSRPELGQQILERVGGDVVGLGKIDGDTRKQDWAVSGLLVPAKTGGVKTDAKVKNTQSGEKTVLSNGQKESGSQESV